MSENLIEVEAFQYDGDMIDRNGEPYAPTWALKALEDGTMYYKDAGYLYIKTPNGDHYVPVGDYIIRDDDGKLSACNPCVFLNKYKAVTH